MYFLQVRFPNPFPGKPAPLNISGLFLLDPTVHMKLAGYPQRTLLEELLGEALTKRVERAMSNKTANPALLDTLVSTMSKGNAFIDSIRAAASGDVEAAAAVEAVGVWESMLLE